ncbi:MAG: 5'-3' exonuclease H3TH domain-containing protein [Myxococcota bacterium]
MRLHLIDGTYELFRCYFGAPRATAPDGTEVGAIRGLLATLNALLSDPDTTHVGIAFDHVIESFRNDLFTGYKTGEGLPEDLTAQFPLAEEAAHALGLTVWPMVEFEADDALASAAMRFHEHPDVTQVLLCTPDKDLAQCVRGERVVMHDRRKKVSLDERGVEEKYGVPPASIPDLLALVGDDADGIPGLPGWGMKSAAVVLQRYRHLEAIPDDDKHWDVKVRGAANLAASLREQRNNAVLYRTLATLRSDAPVSESLDEIRWHGARRNELEALCHRVGERGLLERIGRWR